MVWSRARQWAIRVGRRARRARSAVAAPFRQFGRSLGPRAPSGCACPAGPGRAPQLSHAIGHHLLVRRGAFMTAKAKLREFVQTTLGPTTLRRRPRVARRLMARKLAHPQPKIGLAGADRRRDAVQPARPATPHHPTDPDCAGHRRLGRRPRQRKVLAGLLPNARVQRFEGAGHLLYWEQPKRFVRAVTDFLTDPATAASVPTAA
jgi:pimeloyl-ACP methyl ester carboxylesterase